MRLALLIAIFGTINLIAGFVLAVQAGFGPPDVLTAIDRLLGNEPPRRQPEPAPEPQQPEGKTPRRRSRQASGQ